MDLPDALPTRGSPFRPGEDALIGMFPALPITTVSLRFPNA
jgi:hypothetical protein